MDITHELHQRYKTYVVASYDSILEELKDDNNNLYAKMCKSSVFGAFHDLADILHRYNSIVSACRRVI